MISITSRECHHCNADFIPGNRWISAGARSGEYGRCSNVVTLFFAKKCYAKTDRCAGALSWRRNHLLALHISRRFLLTASLGRRRLFSFFTAAIPVNYTNKFLQIITANSGNFLKLLREYTQIGGTWSSIRKWKIYTKCWSKIVKKVDNRWALCVQYIGHVY